MRGERQITASSGGQHHKKKNQSENRHEVAPLYEEGTSCEAGGREVYVRDSISFAAKLRSPPFLCPCPVWLLVRVVATFGKRPALLSVQLCVCFFLLSFVQLLLHSMWAGARRFHVVRPSLLRRNSSREIISVIPSPTHPAALTGGLEGARQYYVAK